MKTPTRSGEEQPAGAKRLRDHDDKYAIPVKPSRAPRPPAPALSPISVHDLFLVDTVPKASIEHDAYCDEGGRCKRHKGIEPGMPKGVYCCKFLAEKFWGPKRIQFPPDAEGRLLVLAEDSAEVLGELSPESAERLRQAAARCEGSEVCVLGRKADEDLMFGHFSYSRETRLFDIDVYVSRRT